MDVFLLDVVVSVAADEIQTEDHGVEGQGNAGRGRDGVDFAGIEKQDIAGRNRECPAVDMGSSVSFREKSSSYSSCQWEVTSPNGKGLRRIRGP